MIDQFTRATFEAFLDGLAMVIPGARWQFAGEDRGELCYWVFDTSLPNENAGVYIRSSMSSNGIADGAGEDSIRIYLKDISNRLLSSTHDYTSRVHGWQQRLSPKISMLLSRRAEAGDCPECHQPLMVNVSTTAKNPDRVFRSCQNYAHQSFAWMDECKPAFWSDRPLLARFKEPVETKPSRSEAQILDELGFEALDPVVKKAPSTSENIFASMDEELGLTAFDDGFEEPDLESIEPAVQMIKAPTVFTDEQIAAIHSPLGVPARVLAAPGSGKSTLLRARYLWMLEQGISAETISVITYTKAMATEFLDKLLELRPDLSPRAQAQISTIHAFCFRMLKEYNQNYKLRVVAAPWELKKTVEGSIAAQIKEAKERPSFEEVYDWICASKSEFVQDPQVLEWYETNLGQAYSHLAPVLTKARADLKKWMTENNKIDFPDMIFDFEYLLNFAPPFLFFVQNKIKELMVDEAQDTNAQAMRIIRKISKGHLMLVGDQDQMMFRFNGATPEDNLGVGFESYYPEGLTYFLSVNFRATQSLVEAAGKIIARNYASQGGPYPDHLQKSMLARPGAPEGSPPFLAEYDTPSEEACQTVKAIETLLGRGYLPGDFFIGARTRAQLAYAEMALSKTEIPYVNVSGSSFWDLRHVSIMIDYLRLAVDNSDRSAFEAVCNVPTKDYTMDWKEHSEYGNYVPYRFFQPKVFAQWCEGSMRGVLNKVIKGGSSLPGWQRSYWGFKPGAKDFFDFVSDITQMLRNGGTLQEVLKQISEDVVLPLMRFDNGSDLASSSGDGSYGEDIASVLDIASGYSSAVEFLGYVTRMREIARSNKDQAGNLVTTGKVVLSTGHSLKGKERKVIFGLGISEGETGEQGLLPHTYSLIDPPQDGKLPVGSRGLIEDELCVFFVIFTRAQELVFLSSVRSYRNIKMIPSRFLSYV